MAGRHARVASLLGTSAPGCLPQPFPLHPYQFLTHHLQHLPETRRSLQAWAGMHARFAPLLTRMPALERALDYPKRWFAALGQQQHRQ